MLPLTCLKHALPTDVRSDKCVAYMFETFTVQFCLSLVIRINLAPTVIES